MQSNNPSAPDYQVLVNIAELCYQKGMQHIVLSPGSRSAPLALAFWRHGSFECRVVPDERSAAYQALGTASSIGNPVGLICTSGTAALNYTPAIAEAYWQELPLVAFTADRPPEWIGQGENQAIHQQNIYASNCKAFYEFPSAFHSTDQAWHAYQLMNQAFNTSSAIPYGPVQVNVPLREPLYPESPLPNPEKGIPIYKKQQAQAGLAAVTHTQLTQTLKNTERILVVAGMGSPKDEELRALGDFVMRSRAVLVADPLANVHQQQGVVTTPDLIARKGLQESFTDLKPELLITFGGSLISKVFKQFIRTYKPDEHWHISEGGEARDTFQSLTRVIPLNPFMFFRDIGGKLWPKPDNNFRQAWHKLEGNASAAASVLATERGPFSEPRVVKSVLANLPEDAVLHLGNSLPVRHLQLLAPLLRERPILLKGNRGTSGIDGCLSTAIGYALKTYKQVYALIGDVAFMYDRNALWINDLPSNLRIIVLNNNGGGVFRTLPGALEQPELEPYFASVQHLNFKATADQHNCTYTYCDNWSALQQSLSMLKKAVSGPTVVEISFQQEINFHDQSAIHTDLLAKLWVTEEAGHY